VTGYKKRILYFNYFQIHWSNSAAAGYLWR